MVFLQKKCKEHRYDMGYSWKLTYLSSSVFEKNMWTWWSKSIVIEINEQGYNPKEKRVAVNECLTKIVRERRMAVSWKRKVLLQQKQLKKRGFVEIREKATKAAFAYKNLYLWKFRNICKKASVLETLFNRVAGLF